MLSSAPARQSHTRVLDMGRFGRAIKTRIESMKGPHRLAYMYTFQYPDVFIIQFVST